MKRPSRPPKTREAAGPASELILYQTEDGRSRIECRLENRTIWLTQLEMARLFETTVQNVNQHVLNILKEGEATTATIKDYLIVRTERGRDVRREVKHYNLDMVLAVGYRVRSDRGTQFRQWATARLSEYLVKGFLLDDERLKDPDPGRIDYFDEVLERIRDIRSSERRMYLKVRDIFALAADYRPESADQAGTRGPASNEAAAFEERWTGGYIFENEWQSFRTRQNRDLELTTAPYTYSRPGRYTVAVKVIDIFGNDTTTLLPVNIG